MSDEPSTRQFFEAAVLRLMDRMYGAALRLTRNTADAEDLVAETVEKAWTRVDQLRDRDSIDGWLMRVLSNTFISNWRSGSRERELVEDGAEDDIEPTQDAYLYSRLHQPFLLWFSSPEQNFVNNLLRRNIEAAIDSLPDEYRIVFLLVEVLGYSYAESADALSIPVGTVRSRLNRGRGLLQKSLWREAREAGIGITAQHN
jgi:RNA polymerase sigma-70 factor (ECF subfamily)